MMLSLNYVDKDKSINVIVAPKHFLDLRLRNYLSLFKNYAVFTLDDSFDPLTSFHLQHKNQLINQLRHLLRMWPAKPALKVLARTVDGDC